MASWMTMQNAFAALQKASPDLATQYFGNVDSFVLQDSSPPDIPTGWATNAVWNFRAYSAYVTSSQRSGWVLYDPETWDFTPLVERQHPKAYIDAFAQLAHARGSKVITSPVRGLTGQPEVDCPQLPGEDLGVAYLRCQIPAAAASCEVLDVQAQPLQTDLAAYTALVQGARAQRPNQPLWAGLTTLRGDPVSDIVACYEAVKEVVDGFWLNASAPTIATVIAFFKAI